MPICCLPHECSSDMEKLCSCQVEGETHDGWWLGLGFFQLSLHKFMSMAQTLLTSIGKVQTSVHRQFLLVFEVQKCRLFLP